MSVDPTEIRAPAAEQLPFGIPVTKKVSCAESVSLSGEMLAGLITPDAVQWKGFQLYQSEADGMALEGIEVTWWSRAGNEFSGQIHSINSTGTPSKPKQGVIEIPNNSSKITITPLFKDASRVSLCGFTVSYLAPDNNIYIQTAVIDAISDTFQAPQIILNSDEVLAGIQTAYLNIDETAILNLKLLVARFPFGVQHTDIMNPTSVTHAKVSETDQLLIEQIDNTNGNYVLTGTLALAYVYTDSHTVVDTKTSGFEIAASVTGSAKIEAGVVFDAEVSFSMTVGFTYTQTNTHITSSQQVETKQYTATALVNTPVGSMTNVSLTGYTVTNPSEFHFECDAKAIYSWFLYTTGGIYNSDPISTTLAFINIKQTVHFNIHQNEVPK